MRNVRKILEEIEKLLEKEKSGFTDRVLLYVKVLYDVGDVKIVVVTSKNLKKISELIPPENLKDRQNESPALEDFLKFAEAVPEAMFLGYVVPKERDDERITIDGVVAPYKGNEKAFELLLRKALEPPDEDTFLKDGRRKLWWD